MDNRLENIRNEFHTAKHGEAHGDLAIQYLLNIIEHYEAGFEVLSDIPMSMHPSEIKDFSKRMLKGEKPYILQS